MSKRKRRAEHEQRVLNVLDLATDTLVKPQEFLDVLTSLRLMYDEAVAVHGDDTITRENELAGQAQSDFGIDVDPKPPIAHWR